MNNIAILNKQKINKKGDTTGKKIQYSCEVSEYRKTQLISLFSEDLQQEFRLPFNTSEEEVETYSKELFGFLLWTDFTEKQTFKSKGMAKPIVQTTIAKKSGSGLPNNL